MGYSLLNFGEFDDGGLKNNLRCEFTTPFEQVLGLIKYDIIKIESALLDGFKSPEGNQFIYFRVLNMRKISNGLVKVVTQAYNELAYQNFEIELNGQSRSTEEMPNRMPGLGKIKPLTFGDAPYYENGNIIVPPISEW